MVRLLSYSELRKRLFGPKNRVHLLLGNGFSIGCDPVFHYRSLYQTAVARGLSERAQKVFEKVGTNNFEGVMRLLEHAKWVADQYGLNGKSSEILDDLNIVKDALVGAVAEAHLDHTGKVPDEKKDSALRFLSHYHHVFTTNYDLLLYWVVMHTGKPLFQDGFGDQPGQETDHVVFNRRLGDKKGIFFLHGALHLYLDGDLLCKHTWIRTGHKLTDLIRASLEKGRYPVFVAEGDPEKKLEQIQRIGYLWYCMDKFSRLKAPLVVYGHSLGESDNHIATAIENNRGIRQLYVGIYGDPNSDHNSQIIARANQMRLNRQRHFPQDELEVYFYDSVSAGIWDNSPA